MLKHNTLLILFTFLMYYSLAQNSTISGKVVDRLTNQSIEYANVIIKIKSDSSFISGGITNAKGVFRVNGLSPGNYTVEIRFIGYQSQIKHIFLAEGKNDIGVVSLSPSSENIDEITVSGNKSSIIYKVDRKVVNAGSFPEATSGIELLENVPSLQVGIDGRELKYRGDGVFTVFINGQAVSNGVERLRTLPARQIDKIEVITNPSAKYAAEGTAGIINVILKKTRLEGYAISSSYTTETRGSNEWLFSVSKNGEKGGWYINGQYSDIIWNYSLKNTTQEIWDGNSSSVTTLETTKKGGGKMNFIEAGFNYDITPRDEVDFSFYLNPFDCTNENNAKSEVNETAFVNDILETEINYDMKSNFDFAYQYFGPAIRYKHDFDKNGSKFLALDFRYSTYLNTATEKNIDTKIYADSTVRQGYFNTEKNEQDFNASIDYESPIGDKYKVETGFDLATNHIPKSGFENGYFDENEYITPFDNYYKYQSVYFQRDVYSAYLSFTGKLENIEYKAGIRSEYTVRKSDYSYSDDENIETKIPYDKDFNRLFPSFHAMYSFTDDHQIAFSFTQRISRPEYYQLMPVKQYDSPFSYVLGNAALKPAYTNAVEVNYKRSWNNNFFSAEVFTRFTDHVIEYYTRVDASDLLYSSPENVGKSRSIGSEIMGTYNFSPWWISSLSLSLYSYKLMVDIEDVDETTSQFNSDVKFNNTFKLPQSLKVKVSLAYNSPTVSAQSKTTDYFLTKIAVTKSFFSDSWSVLLYTNSILGNIKYRSIDEGSGYYINSDIENRQYFGFSLAYNFNNQE